ncbi:MAG: complex I NDUFA9 subunit family protein [Deltaproteobacteria bacterium]|nr:complex I NDUFA9 subunit family protein [Deltaproteobacteria bacterium]
MILVTGAAGFVGRHLVKELTKQGKSVRSMIAPFEQAKGLEGSGNETVIGDITERASVFDAINREIDTVVHLAGVLTETKKIKFKSIHVDGTRNIVDACREKRIKRFLFTSVLGAAKDAPSTNHRSKWECEEMIKAAGLEYTIFRPSVIFGPNDRFTNLFAEELKRHLFIPIPDGGNNKIQPIYVGDLARAIALSIDRDDTRHKTYELAGPDVLTFKEMVDSIDEVIGKRRYKASVPIPVMYLLGWLYEALRPKPRLTRDLVTMLRRDYVSTEDNLRKVFGIKPTGFVKGMKGYLR